MTGSTPDPTADVNTGPTPPDAHDTVGPRSEEADPRRMLLIGGLVLLLGFAVMIPLALVLDRRIDRTRPMYDDVHAMEVLQYEVIQKGGRGQTLTVAPGQSVRVGRYKFKASRGVTIDVRVTADEYCVRGENTFGDATDWTCDDGSTNPA